MTTRGVDRRIAAAALITSAFSIATSSVLVRRAYDFGASAETVLVFRVGVPAVVFLPWLVAIVIESRDLRRYSRTVFLFAGLCGLLLLVLNLLELKALERAPVALVVLIISLAPLWISLGSWLLWRVPLGWRGALAIVIALAGTTLIMGTPSGRIDAVGFGFSLAASILAAGLYVLLERKLYDPPPQAVIAVASAVATVGAIAIEPDALEKELGNGGSRAAVVIGAGLAVSATLLLLMIGIRSSSAFVAAIAAACEPVFAGVLAWSVLGETLTVAQLAGGAFALVGLGIALSAVSPGRGAPVIRVGER